jgi:membrane protein implicated in regulation of membrane protease activity
VENYLWWAIAGIVLIIAELVSGTFYLLVIGIAALAGAGVAYSGYSFWIQTVVAAAVTVVGVLMTHRYRAKQASMPGSPPLDVGQSVVLDAWVNQVDGVARVRYRNALWDAKVISGSDARAGDVLYISGLDGSTLHVTKARTA